MENKNYESRKIAKMTQCERVLWYMKEFGGITSLEAMRDLGIMRLGSRIHDIKHKLNVDVKRKLITVDNRFGEHSVIAYYYLEEGGRKWT